MSDLIGSIDMEEMDQQIRAADDRLPDGGTAEFLSWVRTAIKEHGFVVVYDCDAENQPTSYRGDEYTFVTRRNDD